MVEKIIICQECKGSGKREKKECTDYHHNDYDVWDEPCDNCDGSGRMVEQILIRRLKKSELELRPKKESQ